MRYSPSDWLCIIPARGGSKGVQLKNLRKLAGRSLLEWCSASLQVSSLRGCRTVVSTDDELISSEATRLGLEVVQRPAELATDSASLVGVVEHTLMSVSGASEAPTHVLLLLPTQPFRDVGAMDRAIGMMSDDVADAVLSVKVVPRSPSTLFLANERGFLEPLGPRKRAEQRQSIPPIYTPCGCFFTYRVSAFLEEKSLYPTRTAFVVTDYPSNHDIDTENDLRTAECLLAGGAIPPPPLQRAT